MTDWFVGNQRLGTGMYKKGSRFRDRFQRELKFMEQWKFTVRQDDTVYMMGNMVHTPRGRFDITWYNWLSSLPGHKVLMLGSDDNVLFYKDGSHTRWYESFGFDKVIPFNQFYKYKYIWNTVHHNTGRKTNKIVNVMLTCLPASGYLHKDDEKYLRLHKKFRVNFTHPKHRFSFNLHSHTRGSSVPDRTFDISIYNNLMSMDQIIDKYVEISS